MDLYSKFKRRNKEFVNLWSIVEGIENDLSRIKSDWEEDLQTEKIEDNKKIYLEIIGDIDPLEDNIDDYKIVMAKIKQEIDECLVKSKKQSLTIDEVLNLLIENVEIKKKLREIWAELDLIVKKVEEMQAKYPMKTVEAPAIKAKYKAAKGDPVDEMLGNWINTHGWEIEIHRLGGGFYMFGDKKIYAKIVNGKLIIRVGGGFMNIDEFMKFYGMTELAKQQRMYELEYESVNWDDFISVDEDAIRDNDEWEVIGIHQAKKNLRDHVNEKLNK